MIRFDAMVGRFNRLNETLITDWIARGRQRAGGLAFSGRRGRARSPAV